MDRMEAGDECIAVEEQIDNENTAPSIISNEQTVRNRLREDDIPVRSTDVGGDSGGCMVEMKTQNDVVCSEEGGQYGEIGHEGQGDNVASGNDISGKDGVVHECQFKRGMCVIHKIKGRKTATTTKKWADRKNGRGYGWVYSRQNQYVCPSVSLSRNKAVSSNSANSDSKDSGIFGVATIVQGTIVQGTSCPRRLLSKGQLSKQTLVQGDFCPR